MELVVESSVESAVESDPAPEEPREPEPAPTDRSGEIAFQIADGEEEEEIIVMQEETIVIDDEGNVREGW